jgi:hypothetical protein
MTDLEFAIVLTAYGALLACGVGFIVFAVLDFFAPSGSRRRRW